MDFFLFLLVNAALFIRPGELIPALYGWPIYNYIILASLLVSAPAVLNQLNEKSLMQNPITVCVLGVWLFIVLSHLARADFGAAWEDGFEFAKVVAYFLLLMGVVNTSQRLFILLGAVVVFTVGVNVIAVLHYHHYIDMPTIKVTVEGNANDGTEFARMGATGIFGDPNDLSMIIVACLFICAAGFFCSQLGLLRFMLAAPAGFLFYCLTLTHSRGGMLALFVGCAALGVSWLGTIRAGMVGVAGVPLLLMGVGGRQLSFSNGMSGGTGAARVELWSAGVDMLRDSPLFGVGYGHYVDYAGQVAHNAFVHAFAELGFIGGALFLGMFAIEALQLWSLTKQRHEIANPGLAYFLPFLIAIVVGYCGSMMSLSQTYNLPTFMIAGLTACYLDFSQPGTSAPPVTFDGNLVMRILLYSTGFLGLVYLYIKFFFR